MPRKEQIPLTIDAQYVEGFNWLRVPQFRVVEDFGHGIWAGVSAESPQVVTSPITAPSSGVNYTNPGNAAGLLNNTTTYSNDYVPDFDRQARLRSRLGPLRAQEPPPHVHGSERRHESQRRPAGASAAQRAMPLCRSSSSCSSAVWSATASAATARASCPMLRSSGPARSGRRSTNGKACSESSAHPWTGNDIYVYGGWEHADRAGAKGVFTDSTTGKFAGAPGYGSPNLDVSGCDSEGGTCQAQTSDLQQITGGFWQDVYKGDYGRFALGLQGGEIWRGGFSGTGGNPNTNIGSS